MEPKEKKERIRDSKYFKISAYSLVTVCIAISFYYLIHNFSGVGTFIGNLARVIIPFIIGIVIAYLLNPFLNFQERHLKDKIKNKKVLRATTIVTSIIVLLLIVWALLWIILPKLFSSIQDIAKVLVNFFNTASVWVTDWLEESDWTQYLTPEQVSKVYEYFDTAVAGIYGVVKKIVPGIIGFTGSLTRVVLNFVLGVIISIYILYGKEKLGAQSKKAMFAVLKEQTVDKILNFLRLTDGVFGNYVIGQMIDAAIVGVLCFISMTLFRLPYALLISVVVAVTNIIPYFGPFLGAIPSGLILLTIAPKYAVIFAILILVIQQIDGNIIKPKVLGESTGLSGLWILFSVTIGGRLFGVLGMLLGVPVFAIIYASFVTWSNHRLEKKGLSTKLSNYSLAEPQKKSKKHHK